MVLFDLGVRVPFAACAAVELHKTHSVFNQPPRQQTVAAKHCRLHVQQSVKFFGRLGFFRQIHCFRRFGLHPERQLVAADAGVEFAVFGPLERIHPVDLVQEGQFAALLFFADASWRIEVRERLGCRPKPNALINCRHEPRAPIARPADDLAAVVAEHREGRQVLVLGAQPVADPRPQGGPPAENRAGVHLADAVGMIQPIAPAGADDGNVIHTLRRLRQPIGDPDAALAVLLPLPPVGQQWRFDFAHGRDDRAEAFGQLLPGHFAQLRFVIERVEVARPAFHEQEYHAPGFGGEMRRFG